MSRIGIYTDVEGAGFKALAPYFQLPATFSWTRDDAIRLFMPALRDEVNRLRKLGRPIPRGLNFLPANTRGELHFITI